MLAPGWTKDFSLTNGAFPFPGYTLSGHRKGPGPMGCGGPCDALCVQYWPPVLTSGRPHAGQASTSTRSG